MRIFLVLLIFIGQTNLLLAVPASRAKKAGPVRSASKSSAKSKSAAAKRSAVAVARKAAPSNVAGGPWLEPTFADSALGDVINGEDLIVRRAAVDALGPYNGSVVVADPQTGRLLTIVNQKLALGSGFQPCSTVKIVTAIAGLKEGIIEKNTVMRIGRRTTMNLTEALAHSNNPYFARVGTDLGFDRVHAYAKMLGLGERAGLNIEGEFPGVLASEPPKFGGVGMMTSFGEGIQLTALQLASLLSAIANGGTLYHLQYPRTKQQLESFAPKVKRHLAIQNEIPDVKPGMMAAVDHGTARRAQYDANEPILGKTGTCTDRATPTHLGWFGSFNEVGRNKLVVVVLLTGGKPVNGPVAAQVAGSVYRNLSSQQFFAVAK